MRTGERHEGEDQHAIADVAKQIAKPEASAEQSPECRVAPAFRIAPIACAAERKGGEYSAGEDIEPMDVDHRRRRSNCRSRNSKRAPWMKNAQIALGIAHTDS